MKASAPIEAAADAASKARDMSAPAKQKEIAAAESDKAKKLSFKETRELTELEVSIPKWDERLKALDGEMALAATRALNQDRVLAAEAGTGVGKSFAYLVPAILWAVKNRSRVVVSTGTINLQEQLISKDLPLLERVLPVKFGYALAKGRGNYACRRKVEELARDLEQGQIPGADQEREELRALVE